MFNKNHPDNQQRRDRVDELIAMAIDYQAKGNYHLAQKNYHKALQLNPHCVPALAQLAISYLAEHALTEAHMCLRRALHAAPTQASLYQLSGQIHTAAGDHSMAITCYEKALELDAAYTPVYPALGDALQRAGQADAALQIATQHLNLAPHSAIAQIQMGDVLAQQQQFTQAIAHYQHALRIDAQHPTAIVHLAMTYQRIGAWRDLSQLMPHLITRTQQQIAQKERATLTPMAGLYLLSDSTLQRDLEKNHAAAYAHKIHYKNRRHEFSLRLRIGYIINSQCNDIALWLGNSLTLHDKSRIETYVYAQNANFPPAIKHSCSVFTDISKLSHTQAATKMTGHRIHVLVDLSAYSAPVCLDILAHRPAPIQCHLFGYPGSLGSIHVDYQLTTATAVPDKLGQQYTEKLIYLPHVPFSAAGFTTPIPKLSRSNIGLPQEKFIFCYLNPYQLFDQDTFIAWCQILQQTGNSILWLMTDSDCVKEHIYTALASMNLPKERIVFTPTEQLNKRWIMQLADVWLDNFNHSSPTASMLAHWVGLPYLTLQGNIQATRLVASYAAAANLHQAIALDRDAYVRQAVYLAQQPELLASWRQQLQDTRSTTPLFHSQQFIRDLETAYLQIWKNYQLGKEPTSFTV